MMTSEEKPGNGHKGGLEVCVDAFEASLRALAKTDPQKAAEVALTVIERTTALLDDLER